MVSDVYVILGYMCLVLVYTGRSNVLMFVTLVAIASFLYVYIVQK